MFYTPRFSYGTSELTVSGRGSLAGWSCLAGYTCGLGGWAGEYYPPSTVPGEVPYPAKRAPEAQHGLEWVGYGAGRTREYGDGGGDGPGTTSARPGR